MTKDRCSPACNVSRQSICPNFHWSELSIKAQHQERRAKGRPVLWQAQRQPLLWQPPAPPPGQRQHRHAPQ